MAQRGMVMRAGGSNRPWITRFADTTSPSGDPYPSLREGQIPVEQSMGKPLAWRQLRESDGTPSQPETWVAEDVPTAAAVVGGQGPWSYTPGDQLVVAVGSPGVVPAPVTITLTATPAQLVADAAGPYAPADNESWTVTLTRPSGVSQVAVAVGASPGAQSAADTAAWLNANAVPPGAGIIFTANTTSNTLRLESVAGGDGVSISATGNGALAASLGFTSANLADTGTGVVPDTSEITVSDAYNMIKGTAQLQPAINVEQSLVLGTRGVGVGYSLQVNVGGSTMTFDFDGSIHYGTGP